MFFYRVLDVNIGVSFSIHHNQVNNGLATKDLGRFALYIYEQGRDRFYCAEAQRPTLS